ncbi:hypothetical protein H0O00_05330 [Candidatus Micrarchaeota archaeon]|nr:hypothetical protein [Candidatus Micrarchaeota archaeon]
MRGFVITILSVSLIMMLVMLAMSLRNAQLGTERALLEPLPLTYAAFLLDDVGYELNSLVGPRIVFKETNESMGLAVSDTLHGYNHSAEMSFYSAFLAGEVATRTASNITTNFTNMTDGVIRVFIAEDYIYSNDHTKNESLFTKSDGTGATSYDINITITAVRSNVTHMAFNDNGTLNVTIRYTDLNGTGVEEGRVFPDQPNTLRVDYEGGGSILVALGPEGGNDGSLRMEATGISAETAWAAVLPPLNATKRMGYEYDATIEYVQGKVAKSCRIGK